MFSWFYKHKKFEIILSFKSENYFLNREANNFKFIISQDSTFREILIQPLLQNKDSLVALHGLNLSFSHQIAMPMDSNISKFNEYIMSIFSEDFTDYINYTLKNEFYIVAPESLFNRQIWTEIKIYQELNICFRAFFEYRSIDISKSLLNLNLFNNLIFDKICKILQISKPANEYGVNLNSGCIEEIFPITNRYFTEINEKRNQKTEAHVYDKVGELRIIISPSELEKIIKKQKKALEEICNFDFLSYL
ncbi:hypothetical protein PN456_06790 [Nodularia spumigena CS-586/05]|uniref:hypothetical protein n=1 Tax=Nodularia spumigena TaxID=70799 RepID=UPI00232D559A|nr:hypothetical protein [Nodularia spumigena]MDB9345612.1 hypothetical protein [Nodularia spumigena CS-588/06]MDB9368663.1 hypothetical protein [Nodularia spumigena CS-586/05]